MAASTPDPSYSRIFGAFQPTGAALVVHGKHGVPAALHKAQMISDKNGGFWYSGSGTFHELIQEFSGILAICYGSEGGDEGGAI